jgi:hypothetical protein
MVVNSQPLSRTAGPRLLNKVRAAFEGQRLHLPFTNLADDQEKVLREAFAE